MTTRVTIKNEEESGHEISMIFLNQIFVISPGDSLTTHVWGENTILIKELPTQDEFNKG